MSGQNSADRILAILDVFTENQLEWTSEDLMERLGYSRPTLYRYLRTLRDAGFMTSLPGKGFTLGPRVVELDFLMRKSDALVREGKRHLEHFAKQYPCTALLVRWYGNKLLCVASECATDDAVSSYPRGRPMPLARGAISRAILAHLPKRQLKTKIEENFGELCNVGLGESAEDIADSLRRVRRDGFAVARGEVTQGVVGIAAPVFDAGRTPIAALCTTVREAAVNERRISEMARGVCAAAQDLSAALSDLRTDEADNQTRWTA